MAVAWICWGWVWFSASWPGVLQEWCHFHTVRILHIRRVILPEREWSSSFRGMESSIKGLLCGKIPLKCEVDLKCNNGLQATEKWNIQESRDFRDKGSWLLKRTDLWEIKIWKSPFQELITLKLFSSNYLGGFPPGFSRIHSSVLENHWVVPPS